MTSGLLASPPGIVFKMCPSIFSILWQPPFKRLIKLFLCWQVSFLCLFIFTADPTSLLPAPPLAGNTLHLPQPGAGSPAPKMPSHIRGTHTHTHTLCHTLLHRLVSIINRLAWQEACAAAAHGEAGKEWGPARGSGFGIFNNHEPRFQLQR